MKPEDDFYRLIGEGHERLENLDLTRGQYRVQVTVPYKGEADTIRNQMKRIKVEDELKRIFFYKIDLVPQEKPDPETGEKVAKVTLVFRVLDNAIPLAPIAWGVTSLITGAGVWLNLDKVERVSANPLALLPILAVLGTIVFALTR